MKKFGLQSFTLRELLGAEGTTREAFKKVAAMGYSTLQLSGFSPELPIEIYKSAADAAGLPIVGTHYPYPKLLENPASAIEVHRILGTTNIGIGAMPPEARTDRAELMKFIDDFNSLAKMAAKEGMKLTYHNHSFEFIRFEDGVRPWDILVEAFDPENISFVLDTYWLQNAGVDSAEWLYKLRGRVDILHLKDMAVEPGGGGTPKITSIGDGNINFAPIIKAADETGVSYIVVEQDRNFINDDPLISIERSAEAMKRM